MTNSINANQPEKNHQDLSGQDAVARIKATVKKSPNCFFCTCVASPVVPSARPMNVRQVDEQGNLWFLSASDSHLNMQLGGDSKVALYFQGGEHSDFLELIGDATISTTRSKIEELWEPILSTWFTGGIDDPRITVIKFQPNTGYYWDNKHGGLVAGAKMLIGSLIGKTLDDSIEGTVRP
jgi:general stress protein 26